MSCVQIVNAVATPECRKKKYRIVNLYILNSDDYNQCSFDEKTNIKKYKKPALEAFNDVVKEVV
jgi:hypothetical protein